MSLPGFSVLTHAWLPYLDMIHMIFLIIGIKHTNWYQLLCFFSWHNNKETVVSILKVKQPTETNTTTQHQETENQLWKCFDLKMCSKFIQWNFVKLIMVKWRYWKHTDILICVAVSIWISADDMDFVYSFV